ncbi:Holliday junction resolvase RecU [Gracilibacillus alcaliphilus]|uniref:Holliday junction resolvase RecU n=1 Tax=Gracilibacillus alcaliphilus TaxID=1401441 RepID=UPI001EF81A2E|nr:Holliday junction resolvase RecU [Gracilibacillus alcaliphilus]MBM7678948.1 recombination protein U [Gracilibacillus alcaliphilus]
MTVYTGKRGMELENLINYTNQVYKNKGTALIDKVPTPVKVLRKRGNRITEGFYENKSTVDYQGVYKGQAICFEAKSTTALRLPLKNIHKHQIDYLHEAQKLGAICFFIVEFTAQREVYLAPFDFIHLAVINADKGGRKSIPYDDFNYYAAGMLQSQNGVPLDYLSAVDKLIDSNKNAG